MKSFRTTLPYPLLPLLPMILAVPCVTAQNIPAPAVPPADAKAEKAARDEKLLKTVKAPDALEKFIFASPPEVNYPVYVAASTEGTVYVSSDLNGSLAREPKRGRILRVRDTDGDGRGDEVKHFVPDIDSPRGLVWDHDRLYVMHPPHLSVCIDKDGDGISEEQKVLVKNMAFTFKDRPADHTTNGVTLGIDGWLYIAVGDFGFMEAEGTDGRKLQCRGGGVVRVRPDGTGLELYSFGTRNILEVALSPLLDGFTRDNTNDGGKWDMRFHHFTGLEHHGYPSLYMNFGEEIVQPLTEYGGGSGCGAVWLDEPGYPQEWTNVPMTADWGRSSLFGHTLQPKGATFTEKVWNGVDVPKTTDGDADGNSQLYVASWKEGGFNYSNDHVGYVAMVRPKGYKPEPMPDFAKADTAALLKIMESPSARRRMEAQRTLIRRGVDATAASALEGMAKDEAKPLASRVAAIFALKQGLGAASTKILAGLANVESIRPWAVRALTDHEGQLADVPVEPILAALKGSSSRGKLEGLVSIGRLGKPELASAVAPFLGDADPILAHTAYQVMARLKAAAPCLAILDSGNSPEPQVKGAAFALMRMHEPAVVQELTTRLKKETQPARRAVLVSILARLLHRDGVWKGDSWGTRPDTSGPYYQADRWAESDGIQKTLEEAFRAAPAAEQADLLKILSVNKVKLGSTLPALIAAAQKDAAMLPVLLKELGNGAIPAEARPLVITVATAAGSAPQDRTTAIQMLAKQDGDDAFQAVLDGLVAFHNLKSRSQAERAFWESTKLENHHQQLEKMAASLNGEHSKIAEGGLISLIIRKNVGPEAKQSARANIDAGWGDSKRRYQVLTAIERLNTRDLPDLVLKSVADSDKQVAEVAQSLVKNLRLQPAGPAIETMKVADVLAEVEKTKGDVEAGKQFFTQLGCVTCHTVDANAPQRGPFLGNITDTYRRKELAEMILDPNKTIAQGFATVVLTKKDGTAAVGFVTEESAEKVKLRDIAGNETEIKTADIAKRDKLPTSMMPPGLAAKISVKDLASLLDYLQSAAKKK